VDPATGGKITRDEFVKGQLATYPPPLYTSAEQLSELESLLKAAQASRAPMTSLKKCLPKCLPGPSKREEEERAKEKAKDEAAGKLQALFSQI